ncbi:MAG: tetratricopeptide repeat protein [Anaerolineae bacterium]|nr:tetratricopeptide repeat protein [Anaerolineae bacterium]
MARLTLNLLGPPEIEQDGKPVDGFVSNKVRALLIYLAVEAARPHRRETLAGLLWAEWSEHAARANLSNALSNLRSILGDRQADNDHQPLSYLLVTRGTIRLNAASDYWVDVTAFSDLAAIERGSRATIQQLEKAAALYRGPFLEGFSVAGGAAFEHWALVVRERLEREVSKALDRLVEQYESRGEYEQARNYAWRLVELEPWQEQAHRQLMRLLALNGQRSAALAQYDACRRILEDELDVEPEEETAALYEQIRDEKLIAPKGMPELATDSLAVVFPQERPSEIPTVPFQAPSDVAYFVGRKQELADFCALMARFTRQCVFCLTGMGGVGKTAFAIHVAHLLRDDFVDGVLWANAAISEPMAILDSWSRAYGCDFSSLPDLESRGAAMRNLLSDKKVLLVLDDVRSAEHVHALLPGGDHCTVLLTTRNLELATSLNVPLYPLSPLNLEDCREMMCRILGDQRVHDERACADEMCGLLGNLPLAIEIAAQRLASRRWWTLTDLVERLRDAERRLYELKISDRQVRTSFAVSWDLLDEDLKHSFALLGVFEGRAFTIPAFAAVAGLDRSEAEDHLYDLIVLSLAWEQEAMRYRQHPLLADFAREQLRESDAAYKEMVRYYLDYVVEHQHDYERLELEWDNLSANMRIAYRSKMWPATIDYARILSDVWFKRGHYSDARQGYKWALNAAQIMQDDRTQAFILYQWGRACTHQSDYTQANEHLSESLQLYAEINDQAGMAGVKYELADVAFEQADFARARELLAESMATRKVQLGNELGTASILCKLAQVEYAQTHYSDAQQLVQRALAMHEEANDKSGCIQALRLLISIAVTSRDHDLAEMYCQCALTLCHETKEKHELALILHKLSVIHYSKHVLGKGGDLEAGRDYAEQSLQLFQSMGELRSQAQALWLLSEIDGASGLHEPALVKGQRSLDLCEKLGDLWGKVYLMSHLGDLYVKVMQPKKARSMWQNALALISDQEHRLTDSLRERLKELDGGASSSQGTE